MVNLALFGAALTLTAPNGAPVCTVTPPALDAGARLETTNTSDGVAWRIHYSGTGTRTVTNEVWTFDFGSDRRCWPVSHAQGRYVPKTLSTLTTMKERPDGARLNGNYVTYYPGTAEAPLVVEGPGFAAALGDAAVLDDARLRFAAGPRPGAVQTVLEGASTFTLPHTTPWRYVILASNAVQLANATLVADLNEPSRLADTSWIRPGKVLRVSRLDTATGCAAVDFVRRNNLQYIELDAGWYGPERTGNPLKPGLDPKYVARGDKFDLLAILAYAKQKDVGVLLYVNAIPLEKNRDAILDQLVAWGVKGVKYGFVRVGSQERRAWVIDAIQAAADRHLLVDIHDEFRLTGIQKTFPHVLTVEGIHGNEEMPDAAHDAALPFTRFLDGPGDYTPCWTISRVKNTLAHQLALPCVYTSGLQFLYWYSRPSDVDEKNPALDFWREIPCTFDESRMLQGEIGAYAVMARRVGTKWFVGCVNAGKRRSFSVPLDFLKEGTWRVRLFRDADPAKAVSIAPVACETKELSASAALTVEAAANGGWCAILEPR